MIQRTRISVVTTTVKTFSFINHLGLLPHEHSITDRPKDQNPEMSDLENIIERACEQGIVENNLITKENIQKVYEAGMFYEYLREAGDIPIKQEMNIVLYKI